MKIVIAGAGDVGTYLAKMLSKENHTIIVLDEQAEKIKALETNYDILSVTGSPLSLEDLREAQVTSADLFVAVTPQDSTNITACLLATNLGAKKTLARTDKQEYLLPKNSEFFKSIGVDSLIFPEMLAAREISDALKKGWVRQYIELSDGALTVIAAKIHKNAPICGLALKDAFRGNNIVRTVVIRRGENTLVPSGNDLILDGDIVYFITTKDGIDEVRQKSGKENIHINEVMFMGASRVCIKAIEGLPSSMSCKVIEKDIDKANRLLGLTDRALVINGDGRDIALLKEEEISSYDAFVALTGNSETNILACLMAKSYGVRRTIAEVENFDYIAMAENLDIGAIINKKIITASHIYQMILGGNSTVNCLTFADVEVVELTAGEKSSICKAPLMELRLPSNMTIGGVIRDGQGIVAVGSTHIKPGDKVIVFCGIENIDKIKKLFK